MLLLLPSVRPASERAALLPQRAIRLAGRVPLSLMLIALASGPAWCQVAVPAPAPAPAPAPTIRAPVRLNGETLFQVVGPDPQARALRIRSRLETLVTREADVGRFRVEKQKDSFVLVAGDIPVITVTATDAQDALLSPQELAKEWAGTLTNAVSQARAERRNWIRAVVSPLTRSATELLTGTVAALPRLLSVLILVVLTYYAARLTRRIVLSFAQEVNLEDNLQHLVGSLGYAGAWVIGLAVMASVVGIQASSLVAALGVGGFVLGFAFQDILSHFLAGILLLAGRTFQIGDQIAVQGYEGTVERIDLRATHVRTYDNRLVVVPNADVLTSAVTNNTEGHVRRQEFDVNVAYSARLADAQLSAYETIRATDGVLPDPSPDVLVVDLGAAGVVLRCRFWTDSRRANVMAVGSEARRRTKEALLCGGVPLVGALAAAGIAYQGVDGVGAGAPTAVITTQPPLQEDLPDQAERGADSAKAQAALPHSPSPESDAAGS